jgi:RES domain-containing protein
MGDQTSDMPFTGVWVRHVLAGVDGLALGHGGNGCRFHRPGHPALCLADDEQTAWAEWYRWLAEWQRSPADQVPRDLYRIAVDLERVVDLSSAAARNAAGLPERMRPSSLQWTAFQATGERLAAEGAQGVVYRSAARTRSQCLCVFHAGLSGLRVEGAPVRMLAPPPPPRGLRT